MSVRQYHHGDLKRDLVQKGIQLLAKEGYDGFSLRKLAVLCGVSHAAPYKHFKSKEAIIAEISRCIAEEFGDALSCAACQYPDDLRMRLMGVCGQYIRFMVEHPDYFRFVFMTAHGRPIDIGLDNIEAGNRQPLAIALQCAEAYFRPLHAEHWRKDFLALWSMLQGYILMLICQTVRPDDDYSELAQEMIEWYIN